MTDKREALARHLWAEFSIQGGPHTFDQQNESVRRWWFGQADTALGVIRCPECHPRAEEAS